MMGMSLANGGHLSHGSPANISGKYYNVVSYDVDHVTGRLDYDRIRSLAKTYRPRLIIAGASAYPRAIDFKAFADIAHEIGAVLMVDMAHIAGLVAGGAHESPVPYADIVTTTTHKTLRGPRGGLILAKEEYAKKLNSAVFPGTQGGPLEHVIAAKAVCLKEAMQDDFRVYAHNVVRNAATLADAMLEEGFELVTGGTDNHLMLADLRPMHITGKELQHRLDEVGITLNKNAIPGDPEKPSITSGVRIGTAAATTRGLGEEEMRRIARCIGLTCRDFEGSAQEVRATVADICQKFPLYR
jgi:glycine hydroxymethyltransferase